MSVFARVLAAFRGVGVSPAVHREARETMSAPPRRGDQPINGRGPRPSIVRANRLNQIAARYAEAGHLLHVRIADCTFLSEGRRQAAREALAKSTDRPGADGAGDIPAALRQVVLVRRARDLNDRERAILRLADMLRELGEIDRATELQLRLPIVWGKGAAQSETPGFDGIAERFVLTTAVEALLAETDVEPADGLAWLQRAWRNALSLDSPLGEDERRILESYQFIDRAWLTAPPDPPRTQSSAALKLGLFEGSRQEMIYDSPASVITIAPPGLRRRSTLLLQNLMSLNAGAVVLDIDGRAFRETARWRQKRVGRVFAFAPAVPAHSMRYNPLDAVPSDPIAAEPAAQLLAGLLIEPTGDAAFDRRAVAFLAAAIVEVAANERDGRRDMQAVLARLFGSDNSPHREREALMQRIGPQLQVWRQPVIADLTGRTEWTGEDLRRRKATVYLCIDRADLRLYAPVVRTIVGQTMAALAREKAISAGATVTFVLDEAARLGPFALVERMIHGGTEVGVRPWLFFADDADMRAAYPDADALIATCGAQCYIDPDPPTAQALSLRLGHSKSLFGAEQRPLAERDELAGPAFAGRTVALVRGLPPARLLSLDAAAPGQHPERPTRH